MSKNMTEIVEKVRQGLDTGDMTPEQAQEALLTIISNSASLYLQMLKLNLELKALPTERAAVFSKADDEVVM